MSHNAHLFVQRNILEKFGKIIFGITEHACMSKLASSYS